MRTAERTADLVGQSFGSATVIGRVDGKIGSRTWLAVCICGREFTRTTSHLREDAKRGRECKLNMRHECCGTEPNLDNGRHGHNAGCSRAYREWFRDGFDLGGEA